MVPVDPHPLVDLLRWADPSLVPPGWPDELACKCDLCRCLLYGDGGAGRMFPIRCEQPNSF